MGLIEPPSTARHSGPPRATGWMTGASSQAGTPKANRRPTPRATNAGLDPAPRKPADDAANYLTTLAPYLDYPTALQSGWPVATGIVEGACRHLVKDRMDITGARWGLAGAEAVLKLRALKANGHLDAYWQFHLNQEHHHVHEARVPQPPAPIRHMTGQGP